MFHGLVIKIWNEEDMLKDFKDGTVVPLFKNKGSKADCWNCWGISLLYIVGKILVYVLLNCLITSILKVNLPEAQCGFNHCHSTINTGFAVQRLQEKCIKQNMDLYATFINLTQAFVLCNILFVINQESSTTTKNEIARSINKIGIPHGYFLDLLDISSPHEYADVSY